MKPSDEDLAKVQENLAQIRSCVDYFVREEAQKKLFETQSENLENLLSKHPRLKGLTHSTKHRVKETDDLFGKLVRKALDAKAKMEAFDITPDNLFQKVGDLGGVRLLHLHTDQMEQIHPALLKIFEENGYELVEPPQANTWDDEYEKFFGKLGIQTKSRDSMYTSVHYVLEVNKRSHVRCELQVRTLAEELWGEVSHKVDYPDPTTSLACREQLKVLARATSTCTRLVDSIFKSHADHVKGQTAVVTKEIPQQAQDDRQGDDGPTTNKV